MTDQPNWIELVAKPTEVSALELTRAEYNDYRGWTLPDDEDGTDVGYLLRPPSGPESWLPLEAVPARYRAVTDPMNFGDALATLKEGRHVARAGWNGKGMYVYLVPEHINLAGLPMLPSLAMYTVNAEGHRAHLNGWLASQTDMLAEDWVRVLDY